jgi:hypothetical protein
VPRDQIEALRGEGYEVEIVSNQSARQQERLERSGTATVSKLDEPPRKGSDERSVVAASPARRRLVCRGVMTDRRPASDFPQRR